MMPQTEAQEQIRTTLLRRAAASRGRFYAVIDAAQDSSLIREAKRCDVRIQSLYAGRLAALLANAAPHLAALDPNDEFAAILFDRWEDNIGILLQSEAPFEQVRKHLRGFLMVKDTDGRRYRFRFYDPRVLRVFLPVCTADEAAQFFGPTNRFYCAARIEGGLLAFSMTRLGTRVIDITRAAETE